MAYGDALRGPSPSPRRCTTDGSGRRARGQAREQPPMLGMLSSHTSTADLLAWSQPQGAAAPATPSPPRRPGQPSKAIRKVVFGRQVTKEEADSLTKRSDFSPPPFFSCCSPLMLAVLRFGSVDSFTSIDLGLTDLRFSLLLQEAVGPACWPLPAGAQDSA
ncbi:unnamed protein product [Urochloa humidicola]